MTLAANIAFGLLAAAALLALVRLLRGPSLSERIVALDTMLVVIVTGIAVQAARSGSGVFLNVLVVTALVTFVGTVTVARFIEERGS